MKRLALNGRFTGNPQPTGTQKVAFQLFDHILRRNRDFEFTIFADSRFPGVAAWRGLPRTNLVEIPVQDWSKGQAQLWEQATLPRLCAKHRCDVAHHPITTSPFWTNGCKSVVTLHDLNYYLHPEWYSASFRLAYTACATPGLRRADRVVAVSNYVAHQARDFLHVPKENLRTIYNGANPLEIEPCPKKSNPRFILCVGALPPHKNLVRLIKAFQLIRGEFAGLELHLAGRPHPLMNRVQPELSRLLDSPDIRQLGYLSDSDLAKAYAGASVFCFPSLEEGFGLPLLEAMSAGTPVVTSDASCLPEIAGPSAILVDPYSVEAIAGGLRQALQLSAVELASRGAEGKAWAARYSWPTAADAYLQIYAELV